MCVPVRVHSVHVALEGAFVLTAAVTHRAPVVFTLTGGSAKVQVHKTGSSDESSSDDDEDDEDD